MNKFITFGVIVYNNEKYIRRCLDSVIRQMSDDTQIIVVDDGSTDESAMICDEFANRYGEITVIHKENGGASTARNLIIEEAIGDWICFVDGDDMLTEDAVDIIGKFALKEYQIINFDAVYFTSERAVPRYRAELQPLKIDTREQLDMLMLDTVYRNASSYRYINKTVVSVWGKIYQRKFLIDNNIKFDTRARRGQDALFSFCCVRYAEKVLFVREAIYLYRQVPSSAVNGYNDLSGRYNQIIAEAFREKIDILDDTIKENFLNRFYALCITLIRVSAQLDFCHKCNKKDFSERERDFFEYVSSPLCREAIDNCRASELNKPDKIIYELIKQEDFKGICRHIKKKDLEKEIRRVAGILGLNKLKRFFRR